MTSGDVPGDRRVGTAKHRLNSVRLAVAALAALASTCQAAERYVVDPRHSRPLFAVGHLGFSTQHGRFDDIRGSIELDREGRSGAIDITIEAASVDMGDEDWNQRMRSNEFFDVENFPTMIYRSEHLVFEGDAPVAVEGRLALLGTVRPVTLKIERFRCAIDLAAKVRKCGADASATIKRSEFGMSKYVPYVDDDVRLILPIEAILQAETPGPAGR